ncbi:MAG: PPK2 family polyphosphate kinase [Thermodesulfobacteriota bacterium]
MPKLESVSTKAPRNADRFMLEAKTQELYTKLQSLQYQLYKEANKCVLIILQGLDAAGKDSTIRSVFSGVNPMGCTVKAWKVPTEEEYRHDFLWRIHRYVPPKGMIQIFNRSQYEDVIVPQINKSISRKLVNQRYKFLNLFEKLLIEENDTLIFKFFLHISKEKQKEKLDERAVNPEKQWKYNPKDFEVNRRWKEYLKVYDKIIDSTEEEAKWHIIPADNKWYRNYLIADILVDRIEKHLK